MSLKMPKNMNIKRDVKTSKKPEHTFIFKSSNTNVLYRDLKNPTFSLMTLIQWGEKIIIIIISNF